MTLSEFNRTVDLYSDNIYRFLLKNIRNEDAARDILQDGFEKVWLRVGAIPFEKARSYLFTTTYRLMLEWIRREKRKDFFTGTVENDGAFEGAEPDVRRILDHALTRLPEIQRSVILLRDYEGYTYQEIGDITGLSESQVKVYLFRARVQLKNFLVRMDNVV